MAANIRKGVSTTASVVIVVAILIVINLISVNVFSRADLTDNKIYSLSEVSRDLMKNLSDRVTVKCYFSEDLPSPYNQNARYLEDQLAEYRAFSGGRLQFEFIDPAKSGKEEEAQTYRIPPVQVNAYESDKLEIKKVYMGIAFLYEDKVEVMPIVQSTSSLEYEISRIIKKITSNSTLRIAFVTGHGEPDLQQNMKKVNQVLSREYAVQMINLSEQTEVPTNIDALFVVAPKNPFNEWELYVLDHYLMQGGKVGIFLNKYDCDIQANKATLITTGLDGLLRKYGIGINNDLVLDARCARIGVQQQTGFFRIQNMVDYRYFPVLTEFDNDNIIVKGLDQLGFTFISSIDTTVVVPDSVVRKIFAWSSELSASESKQFEFDPYRRFTRDDFDRQHIPLAATLMGKFPSYFAKKDIPAYTGTDTSFVPDRIDKSISTRMIVIGNGNFVLDRNMNSQSNLVFHEHCGLAHSG